MASCRFCCRFSARRYRLQSPAQAIFFPTFSDASVRSVTSTVNPLRQFRDQRRYLNDDCRASLPLQAFSRCQRLFHCRRRYLYFGLTLLPALPYCKRAEHLPSCLIILPTTYHYPRCVRVGRRGGRQRGCRYVSLVILTFHSNHENQHDIGFIT